MCWAPYLVLGHGDEQGSPKGENLRRRQGMGSNKYKSPQIQKQNLKEGDISAHYSSWYSLLMTVTKSEKAEME